ncbi:MAG: threonine synthase [Planctomycetota bacterium]
MFLTHLECSECATRHEADELWSVCRACRAPLVARYDLEAAGARLSRSTLVHRRGGMWRFRELLPLPEAETPVSLGEGGTPLLELPRLARELGVRQLFAKDESVNPTGSFKARGMSVAVSMARSLGARALAAPSAGNAGGALAAYGARAGLPVQLAMPADVPAANRIEAMSCGAQVELLEGTIADCGRWIAERAPKAGWFDLSTLKEPYRVEGKKIMGYELVEQLGWQLPDVILYPTGGGTGLIGIWKAFAELQELGWIQNQASLPRLVAVQAAGCAPIVEAFASGRDQATPPPHPRTLACGVRVPSPLGDRWMLRVLKESHGLAVAVEDSRLLAGSRRLARTEGLFSAPEAGALVAALEQLIASGELHPQQRIVLLVTGAGIKYLECFQRSLND